MPGCTPGDPINAARLGTRRPTVELEIGLAGLDPRDDEGRIRRRSRRCVPQLEQIHVNALPKLGRGDCALQASYGTRVATRDPPVGGIVRLYDKPIRGVLRQSDSANLGVERVGGVAERGRRE